LRSKKMNKTTSTIHRYDNQYVNFKRRLEGTKTYESVRNCFIVKN
jgi:hypothetical protein